MSVRMTVSKQAVGSHDPRVLLGSSPENGIVWEPGDEIVVTDDLAEKFERSGMAKRITASVPVAETAAMSTSETAVLRPARNRRRA